MDPLVVSSARWDTKASRQRAQDTLLSSNDPPQVKGDGVDGQVGPHVDQPAGPYGLAFCVQSVEQKPGAGQPRGKQDQQGRVEPAVHDGHMVQGKSYGGKGPGQLFVTGSVQGKKGKAPEKELLQQGVTKGDIEGRQWKSSGGEALLGL